jgi:hypothetical protein
MPASALWGSSADGAEDRLPVVDDPLGGEQALAGTAAITHAMLDALPASRTREYVRGLLVEHAALPRRDELADRYQHWAREALARVSSEDHREVVQRYLRWHHQRRKNTMDTVTHGTFLRAKQTVTVAIDFLNWLHAQGIGLGDLQRTHLDTWQAEGPTTREVADRFLR